MRVERIERARLVEVLLREWELYEDTEGTDIPETVDARSVLRDKGRSGTLGDLGVVGEVGLQTCWSAKLMSVSSPHRLHLIVGRIWEIRNAPEAGRERAIVGRGKECGVRTACGSLEQERGRTRSRGPNTNLT